MLAASMNKMGEEATGVTNLGSDLSGVSHLFHSAVRKERDGRGLSAYPTRTFHITLHIEQSNCVGICRLRSTAFDKDSRVPASSGCITCKWLF